jgi:hypothetical protein
VKFGEEAVCAMLDALNEAGVSYMLVGSRAELLDWQYIEQWCDWLAIRDKLDELRQA